jgi:hypothetical protein
MEVFSLVFLCRKEANEEVGHRGPQLAPDGGRYRTKDSIMELIGSVPPAEGTHVLAFPLGRKASSMSESSPEKLFQGVRRQELCKQNTKP